MLSKEEKQKIRDLYYRQGINSMVEIARITGYNRKTVTKYIDFT
jgi:transposase-like protein